MGDPEVDTQEWFWYGREHKERMNEAMTNNVYYQHFYRAQQQWTTFWYL